MKSLIPSFKMIYRQLDKILLLFAITFTFMEFIWLPLSAQLAQRLLASTSFVYLSYNNILALLTQHSWVALGFFFLLLANLVIAYLQIGLLFAGVNQLMSQPSQSLRDFSVALGREMKRIGLQMRPSKVLLLLLYVTILLPLLGRLLNISFLKKFIIPQFILDYLSVQYLLGGFLSFLALIFFYLALRLLYVLPLLYFENISVRRALSFSWRKTKGKAQFLLMKNLLGLALQMLFLTFSLATMILGIQSLADQSIEAVSLTVATISFVLIKLSYYGILVFFIIRLVSLLSGKPFNPVDKKRVSHRFRFSILVVACVSFAIQGAFYLVLAYTVIPVSISHRGVTDQNGVQNTIPSLEKTAALKPDFVEMDIQETKDGEFVLMHDADLFNLAGVHGSTHEFTLDQLTKMTVSENGHKALIPSFEDYLDRADQLGQKLLIEFKTSPLDSEQMMTNFLSRYAKRIKAKGHEFHSLDYAVIQAIKAYDADLVAYFILPYNSVFPNTLANGYTMEYSSLDSNFTTQAWMKDKKSYAWTANDSQVINRLMTMEVDGIITDHLSLLKEEISSASSDKNYTYLLLHYMLNLASLS